MKRWTELFTEASASLSSGTTARLDPEQAERAEVLLPYVQAVEPSASAADVLRLALVVGLRTAKDDTSRNPARQRTVVKIPTSVRREVEHFSAARLMVLLTELGLEKLEAEAVEMARPQGPLDRM